MAATAGFTRVDTKVGGDEFWPIPWRERLGINIGLTPLHWTLDFSFEGGISVEVGPIFFSIGW